MPISHDPSAHYVTQSNVWGTMYRGPLTDKKIRQYQKQGYYGQGGILALQRKKKHVRLAKQGSTVRTKVKKPTLEELMKLYVY